MRHLITIFVALGVLIEFFGCAGYQPVATLNKKVFNDEIYARVIVDKENPNNSVLIQNAINEIIVNKFDATIQNSKNDIKTNMIIRTKNINFDPISYDENGYIVSYKNIVTLEILYNGTTYTNTGIYTFSIESQSTITQAKRFEAIQEASSKALDSFISDIIIKQL